MKVVQKKLSDLRKLEKNIRRHSPKQISEYVRSVRMFGQIRPLVIDEDGVILAGNGLYDALVSMGEEKADCYVVPGLTETQKKKLMLADNRVYELGMTDTEAFDEIIRSLGGDTDVPGWDADLLETLNASVREVNAMVDSYGSYQPEDMGRYHREPQNGALQQGSDGADGSPLSAAAPEGETQQNASQAVSARYVICPKCGERIEIGGV
ncbi:MAG: ParB N-terminal domain-containing protein [Clostridia bacterium]|nr:ParB N-terminal domain-containing protein [Clostridia bacterium]